MLRAARHPPVAKLSPPIDAAIGTVEMLLDLDGLLNQTMAIEGVGPIAFAEFRFDPSLGLVALLAAAWRRLASA